VPKYLGDLAQITRKLRQAYNFMMGVIKDPRYTTIFRRPRKRRRNKELQQQPKFGEFHLTFNAF
jgi:hypothetical protein